LITFLKRLHRLKQESPAAWGQANIRQKLGLVWRKSKKISQIIEDYFERKKDRRVVYYWTNIWKLCSEAVYGGKILVGGKKG
jgi:hypothetical protein